MVLRGRFSVLWRCFRHALGELFGVLGVLWWCFGIALVFHGFSDRAVAPKSA